MAKQSQLSEYLVIVADLIKKADLYVARLHLIDLQFRAILNGVRNEDELVKSITPQALKDSRTPEAPPR